MTDNLSRTLHGKAKALNVSNEGHAVVANNDCSGEAFLFANKKD